MMWLAWRQHRAAALYTFLGLLVVAAVVIPSGLFIRGAFADLGLADCVVKAGTKFLLPSDYPEQCEAARTAFSNRYSGMGLGVAILNVLPLLMGLFWGAPLIAREVENGTHRLIWTQGVSRKHWALVKFSMVGGLVIVASACFGMLMSWWIEPLAAVNVLPGFNPLFFDVQGLAPVGYAVFTVAVGIFAGSLGKKTLIAMGITLPVFIVARIGIAAFARPHYLPTEWHAFPIDGSQSPNFTVEEWEQSAAIRDADGKVLVEDTVIGCTSDPANGCGYGAGAQNSFEVHPGFQFWPTQYIETAIYLALAAVLLYLSMRRLKKIA